MIWRLIFLEVAAFLASASARGIAHGRMATTLDLLHVVIAGGVAVATTR